MLEYEFVVVWETHQAKKIDRKFIFRWNKYSFYCSKICLLAKIKEKKKRKIPNTLVWHSMKIRWIFDKIIKYKCMCLNKVGILKMNVPIFVENLKVEI